MSKYDALWEHVGGRDGRSFKLTFDEIGEIAGVEIDHSFLLYKKELEPLGWRVSKISMKERTVAFEQTE